MPAKPNPVLGIVLGIIVGYAGVIGGSYAGTRLALARQVRFDSIIRHGLQWLVLLVVIAAVVGLVMAIRRIAAGVMVGAGALMTVAGLAVMLAPARGAYDVMRLFQLPGTRMIAYMLTDGSAVFLGIVLLIAGIGRWVGESRIAASASGYNPQPQQWGGYPGQPQPQDRQPQPYPGPPQPQPYPGQPQQGHPPSPGDTFPPSR